MTGADQVRVLAEAIEMRSAGAESWLGEIVQRLKVSGYEITPALCPHCGRRVRPSCPSHGEIEER